MTYHRKRNYVNIKEFPNPGSPGVICNFQPAYAWRSTLVLLLAICLVFAAPNGQAYSQADSTHLSIQPGDLPATTCADLKIAVFIEDVVDLYAYSLQISFDPGDLQVVSITNGTFLSSSEQDEFYEPSNHWDNLTGEISFGMTQVRPSEMKSGSGDLVYIYLRAVQPGKQVVFTIEEDSLLVSWPDVLTIPYTSSAGTVVTASCAPTAIDLDNQSIDEKLPSGSLVGNLSTTDADIDDTHTYSLVDDDNYPDNQYFQLNGSQLLSNHIFDYEIKQKYTIKIRSTDPFDEYFEQSFEIDILPVDDLNVYLPLIIKDGQAEEHIYLPLIIW